MRKPNSSAIVSVVIDKEIIEIESDSDTDEVGCRMLALCAPVANPVAEYGEANGTGMEIVCVDDESVPDLVFDLDYKKYLATHKENLYLLEDNVVREGSPLGLLMYNVDNEASNRSKRKAVSTENGRGVHKTVLRTKIKKRDARRGKKIARTKKTIESKTATRKKKEDVRRGRKRNAKSQTVFRASKRVKTENGLADYNSKDVQRKKREKIHVTKNKVVSKSKIHVEADKSFNRLKTFKEVEEKSLSSLDKSYAYYLGYMRNAVTIFKPDQKVKPSTDLVVCLTDPDIIAVSNHPFPDGGNFPFEANKDERVIDIEDGVEADDIFNSSFSKKLMEILRMPYDEKEFLERSEAASLKRPLTRSRELRDGREITYDVKDQLMLSFLEQYPDFKKMYHRYEKDRPRALNLLRGFFFYLENIVREGAFKPWKHEKRLMNMCFDANGHKALVPIE